MAFLRHLVFFLCYSVIAAAVPVILPTRIPDIGMPTAILAGCVVFLAAALLHECAARATAGRRIRASVAALKENSGTLQQSFDTANADFGRAHEAISLLHQGAEKAAQRSDDVQTEVRVLQRLVEELTEEISAPPPDTGAAAIIDSEATAYRPPSPVEFDDRSIIRIVREGLKRDQVKLVLQPIVTLPQRKRRFFEAFTRIHAADGSVLLPQQYISLAEREGLITAIDNMMLFRCIQLIRLMQKRNRDVHFFCNISAHSLSDQTFLRDFTDFMADNTELAPYLVFEIDLAALTSDDADLDRHLDRLSGMGFRFAVDHLSSLNIDVDAMMRRHIKFVKIDAATLLADAAKPDGMSPRMAKRVLDRAGIDLIVSKVETEEALRELLDYNIDFGQGYLFGEPRLSKVA